MNSASVSRHLTEDICLENRECSPEFFSSFFPQLFYDFEDDPRRYADCDDFMFGSQFLVANVVEPGQRERRVYLPHNAEGWYDFHSGAHHPGGCEIVVSAPLDRIPLFARGGAIVPLTRPDPTTRSHDEPSRHLRVFPPTGHGRAAFALYEDDGISLRYRDGEFAEVLFELRTTTSAIALTAQARGRYELPYRGITVELPSNERRKLSLSGQGITLTSVCSVPA